MSGRGVSLGGAAALAVREGCGDHGTARGAVLGAASGAARAGDAGAGGSSQLGDTVRPLDLLDGHTERTSDTVGDFVLHRVGIGIAQQSADRVGADTCVLCEPCS